MWKIRSNIVEYNQILPSSGHGKAIHRHIIFLPILLAVSSCSLQIEKTPPFSTISETCFHISLQFLKLTLIFSTNSISLRFWEVDFTGKYFSTICETWFHLSTISETHFHILYKFYFSKILRSWFHWAIFLYNFCNLFSSLYNFWNLLSSLYNFYLSTNLNTPYQTTYASIQNRHFFHYIVSLSDLPKLWTEPTKIGRIFRKQSTLKIKIEEVVHNYGRSDDDAM